MKYLLLFIIPFALTTVKAAAQTNDKVVKVEVTLAPPPPFIATKDAVKFVNKTVTLCDTVYDYKVVNDTLKLLNIGGRYPNQLLTVAVKGKKIVLKPETLKGKKVCFQGQVTLFKNKPELVATEPEQVVVN